MATVRMTLAEAASVGKVDLAKVDGLTEEDIARFNAEDGFDPGDTMRGLVRVVSPADLRARLGLTQPVMAARLRVPLKTWRNWEQGRVTIEPAARALLDVVAADPEAAFRALGTLPASAE